MDKQLLGQRIKWARTKREVTLDDMAQKIGINKSTISRYERGEIENPKIPVIDAMANYLHVNPSWLIGKSDDMTFTPKSSDLTIYSPANLFVPLKQMREQRGISSSAVAFKLGISEEDYLKIEAGANVDCLHLIQLAEFFCCSTDHLLSFDGVSNEDAYLQPEKELLHKFRQLDHNGRSIVLNTVRYVYDLQNQDNRPILRMAGRDGIHEERRLSEEEAAELRSSWENSPKVPEDL